ncbi:MAG TPA: dienelactone hydrolase family protein [Candidatus Eisenbacteria bacterium]|nr:dienelactone hydrolase family protein [Candidatus Eisenbacteria bacterium]
MAVRPIVAFVIGGWSLLTFAPLAAGRPMRPDTVVVESDGLHLGALFYSPAGTGPSPGILFNPGSGHASGLDPVGHPDRRHPEMLGPRFAAHGYACLYLYRRGDGLSRGQGTAAGDALDRADASGQGDRGQVLIQRLENEDMDDALAGLAALRARPEVDRRRIGIVGHSFGASLSLLLAARDTSLRAAVVFSPAGYSWDRSPRVRRKLVEAVAASRAPMLFVHAANDFSIAPGESLASELHRLGRPGGVRIYPAVGRTPEDGHDFIHSSVATWERDVFEFLDLWMKR